MTVLVLDEAVGEKLIRQRKERGIDRKDEVWDGVYVIMPDPSIPHQRLVKRLTAILAEAVEGDGRGEVFPGTNVSDRREGWDKNFRAPDVVVVMTGSRAVDCDTHWMGGPDFLIEVQSPGDRTEDKLPFYASLGVRELLVIHRDTRRVRLFRHNGRRLAPIGPERRNDKRWLVSAVVPLAFRRSAPRGQAPKTHVERTDGTAGSWVV